MKKIDMEILTMPKFTKLAYQIGFDKIEGNDIVGKKNGEKATEKINNDNQIMIDTQNIGKLLVENNLMEEFSKEENRSLLKFYGNSINKLSNGCISKDEIIRIMTDNVKELERIIEKLKEESSNESIEKIEKMKDYDKLIDLIKDWINNYGCFMEYSDDMEVVLDLYVFLNKCCYAYLLFEKEQYKLKVQCYLDITNDREGLPQISINYNSIFEYINYLVILSKISPNSISNCKCCGELMEVKNIRKKYCSDRCRKRYERLNK